MNSNPQFRKYALAGISEKSTTRGGHFVAGEGDFHRSNFLKRRIVDKFADFLDLHRQGIGFDQLQGRDQQITKHYGVEKLHQLIFVGFKKIQAYQYHGSRLIRIESLFFERTAECRDFTDGRRVFHAERIQIMSLIGTGNVRDGQAVFKF